jgi:hypothetical protein
MCCASWSYCCHFIHFAKKLCVVYFFYFRKGLARIPYQYSNKKIYKLLHFETKRVNVQITWIPDRKVCALSHVCAIWRNCPARAQCKAICGALVCAHGPGLLEKYLRTHACLKKLAGAQFCQSKSTLIDAIN